MRRIFTRRYIRTLTEVIVLAAVVIFLIVSVSVRNDLNQFHKEYRKLQNERITYQNQERELDCRLHDVNDPLCSSPPETTIPEH